MQFLQTKDTYLGHIISENGITVDRKKIKVLEYWPTPTHVRSFLGSAGYYQKLIEKFEDFLSHECLTKVGNQVFVDNQVRGNFSEA